MDKKGRKKVRLAIVSPGLNAYSETFIQAHRKLKADKVYFFYSGSIPEYVDGIPETLLIKLFRAFFKLYEFLIGKKGVGRSALFRFYLKKLKINFVLAEYGTTGAEIAPELAKMKIPFIVHFHGYDASMHSVLEEYRSKYQYMFEKAASIVVVSQVMQKRILSLGATEEKVCLNPYGASPGFLKLSPKFDNQRFLFVGRLVDKKAPYYLIMSFVDVVKKFPDAKLDVIGDGPLMNTCKNLLSYYDLEEVVTLHGRKTHEEVMSFFENSFAFVQHSVTGLSGDMEGLPNSVLEASASALPVVSTIHAGIPDLIENGASGYLVEEHDIKGMSKKMIALLSNTEKAINMGRKGREKLIEGFTQERHLNVLEGLIRQAG